MATPPVYVPNLSRASGPLPDGVLTWDATTKETNVIANTGPAHFVFNFTNVATQMNLGLATNITSITNFATVTNSSFWARLFGEKSPGCPRCQQHQRRHGHKFHYAGSGRHFECASVLRLHHDKIAAVALDTRARHQRPDRSHGEPAWQERHVVSRRLNVYTDKGSKMLDAQNHHSAVRDAGDVAKPTAREICKLRMADRQAVFKGDV